MILVALPIHFLLVKNNIVDEVTNLGVVFNLKCCFGHTNMSLE